MRNAVKVAGGIFASRISGLIREGVAAYFFGIGAHADVFRTALKIPNLLQNLLGEQTLSAAFIPGLSRLIEEGRSADARRFASAVFGLLLASASALALIGVLLARPLVLLISPGYAGDAVRLAAGVTTVDRLPVAVMAVQWTFPMAGILVLSAWALAVLNSHRRFFLPYVAPVVWNAAIIAALVYGAMRMGWLPGGAVGLDVSGLRQLVVAGATGGLVGGLLQFGVQLPVALRLLGGLRPSLSTTAPGVRQALAAFGPAVLGRGVVQLSAFLDFFLASLLAAGAQSALGSAQTLYLLPISLFGMSIAASELPELSRQAREDRGPMIERIRRGLARLGYLTVPTVVGYLLFGYWIVAGVFRRGNFGVSDTWLVYLILAAFSLGLVAANSARLLQNAFYSLDDTRTPARLAAVRVLLAVAVGVPAMLLLDRYAVVDLIPLADARATGLRLGATGLALASVLAAWVELSLLLRGLRHRLAASLLPWRRLGCFSLLALTAAVPAALLARGIAERSPIVVALAVVALFACVYLVGGRVLGWPEASGWLAVLPGRRRDGGRG